jgi:hypothetical protein
MKHFEQQAPMNIRNLSVYFSSTQRNLADYNATLPNEHGQTEIVHP